MPNRYGPLFHASRKALVLPLEPVLMLTNAPKKPTRKQGRPTPHLGENISQGGPKNTALSAAGGERQSGNSWGRVGFFLKKADIYAKISIFDLS